MAAQSRLREVARQFALELRKVMGDHGDVEMPQIRLLGFAIKQELERRPRRKFFRRDVTIEGPRLVMSIGTLERNGPMTAKVDLLTAAPDVMKAWTGAALAIAASLEPSLMELVKIRASQVNGCAIASTC